MTGRNRSATTERSFGRTGPQSHKIPSRQRLTLSPKQYEGYWQKILREGIKSGEFRPDLVDVKVVFYGLLGMLNWAYKWYDPNGRLGFAEVAEQFATLALAGLAAGDR